MAQQGFGQYGGGGGHNGSINPNELNYNQGFGNSYNQNFNSSSNPFGSSAALGDDELLDSLGSPGEQPGQDYLSGGGIAFNQNGFGSPHGGMQNHISGFSNTPEGDPIQSPFVHNFSQYQQLRHPQTFGNMNSSSFAGSPLGGDLSNDGTGPNMAEYERQRLQAQAAQRKLSSTRSPLSPKTMAQSMPSHEGMQSQPIRNGAQHDKVNGAQWAPTPNSLQSYSGSGLGSPLQQNLQSAQLNDFLMKGASLPAKMGGSTNLTASSQEAKRKRRRESHNLVERRRRDNINERIQDLSKLVPAHRLEDDKIKKLISNGTPLSPSLTGLASPTQATSGLAGPGSRRATGGIAGSITTGLPIEDKDKGPNKGDILNGSVSWTKDLMWMLQLKLQQQEELMNMMAESGQHFPFALTDDERRMQTELLEVMNKNDSGDFTYSRTQGTGLRVPHHTDYKGSPLTEMDRGAEGGSISPGPQLTNGNGHHDFGGGDMVYVDDDDAGSGGDIKFERDVFLEEDEMMES